MGPRHWRRLVLRRRKSWQLVLRGAIPQLSAARLDVGRYWKASKRSRRSSSPVIWLLSDQVLECGRVLIEREIVAVWRGRSIHEITKRDVIALLDAIVDRGSPGTANRVYSTLRSMMNWCVERSILDRSPCSGLSDPAPERARDRVLDDLELTAVISAARRIGFPYGHIIEILSLTAQRRTEVSEMMWAEIDLQERGLDNSVYQIEEQQTASNSVWPQPSLTY